MRLLLLLFLIILASSCSSTKNAVKASEPDTQQIKTDERVESLAETEAVEPIQKPVSNTTPETEKAKSETTLDPPPHPPKQEENWKNTFHNHKRWNSILNMFVSDDGKVDYLGIKGSSEFDIYIDILLHNLPEDSWSKEQKLAYWINAYNALTIHLILKNYPLNSIKDIKDPWDQRLWQFGDKWINLNDIEHKILRKMDEPRIHFAIVCASESCPILLNKAFTADNLEEQLTNATKAFLSDTSKNEISENELKLSKIFKWFGKDFKANGGSIIDFLNQYSGVNISQKAKKSFKDYDWGLNN